MFELIITVSIIARFSAAPCIKIVVFVKNAPIKYERVHMD